MSRDGCMPSGGPSEKPAVPCSGCGKESGRGFAVTERHPEMADLSIALMSGKELQWKALCQDCQGKAKVILDALKLTLTPPCKP